MRKAFAVVAALLCFASAVQADVFNMGPGYTNLETVPVGDAGNVPDTRHDAAGYGRVDYDYRIGKYEVTAAQYCEFLNHKAKSDPYGLYDLGDMWLSSFGCKIERSGVEGSYGYSVASNWANRPVNCVSLWDACRFVNWLNNGQGEADTERGAYDLSGYNGGGDVRTVERSSGAKWCLPSEDEWYKAAYYMAGSTDAGYWDYPTRSSSEPIAKLPSVGDPDPGNNANYYNSTYCLGSPYYRTNVGAFDHSGSAYGTYDQGGNVWEWNEGILLNGNPGMRGGSYSEGHYYLGAWNRENVPPQNDPYYLVGFRVASVPEPSAILVVLCGLGGLTWGKKQRR
jgi:formylglycine-generating enzyme required for sulfatase activity